MARDMKEMLGKARGGGDKYAGKSEESKKSKTAQKHHGLPGSPDKPKDGAKSEKGPAHKPPPHGPVKKDPPSPPPLIGSGSGPSPDMSDVSGGGGMPPGLPSAPMPSPSQMGPPGPMPQDPASQLA
jgi:hypothetical protein